MGLLKYKKKLTRNREVSVYSKPKKWMSTQRLFLGSTGALWIHAKR